VLGAGDETYVFVTLRMKDFGAVIDRLVADGTGRGVDDGSREESRLAFKADLARIGVTDCLAEQKFLCAVAVGRYAACDIEL